MKTIICVLFFLACSVVNAVDLPDGSTLIYRGPHNGNQDNMYFRDGSGVYWRWRVRTNNEQLMSEQRFADVEELRSALIYIDDYDGIMGNVLWDVDSDVDGYSDMLEYMTNGDPYDSAVVPTSSRVLYFNGGTDIVTLSAEQDIMLFNDGEETADDLSTVTRSLQRIENLLAYLLVLGSFLTGLVLWRLVILSKSQRNLF